MAMAKPLTDRGVDTDIPRTTEELRRWVRDHLGLSEDRAAALLVPPLD